MDVSNLVIGHTFHGDDGELSGISTQNILTKSEKLFYTVELSILGGSQIKEFSDLNVALNYLKNHNLIYRYIEYKDDSGKCKIVVIHYIAGSERIVGYTNFYGIGGDWKLYVNGKRDIVLQKLRFPETNITVRFKSFPVEKEFYIYLSCLIYTLTNYKLDTEEVIRSTFELVKHHVMKKNNR